MFISSFKSASPKRIPPTSIGPEGSVVGTEGSVEGVEVSSSFSYIYTTHVEPALSAPFALAGVIAVPRPFLGEVT